MEKKDDSPNMYYQESNESTATNKHSSEKDVDKLVDDLTEHQPGKNIGFQINASNQANLNRTVSGSFAQINALFVLIHPYTLDNLDFSDLDINIRMNGHDSILVDGESYKIQEIHPGIRIFGIINEKR